MANNATLTQGTVATYTGGFQFLLTTPVQPVRTFARLQLFPGGDTGDLLGPPYVVLRGAGTAGTTVTTFGLGGTFLDLTPSSQYTVLIEGSAGDGPGSATITVEQLSA